MNKEKVILLLKKQRFLQDSFQQQLMEFLEPSGEQGDVFSYILASSSALRRASGVAIKNIENLEVQRDEKHISTDES